MTGSPLVASLELGGTKCIAALVEGHQVRESVRVATGDDAAATLTALNGVLTAWHGAHGLAAIGIASFGPVDLDRRSATYGHILPTPKPGWSGVDLVGAVRAGLALPIGLDTDVAGAAMAEGLWGAAQGCHTHAYVTIGTGVGLGLIVNGTPLHGRLHPEGGHVPIRRAAGDDFAGTCPFHGDCLEGLVSGPALAARAGRPGAELEDDDPLWALVADEIGQFMAMLILMAAPQRIVLGGGVVQGRAGLMARIHTATARWLGGYVREGDAAALAGVIVPPGLGEQSGILGGAALAMAALDQAC